jgi:hypothetical protein
LSPRPFADAFELADRMIEVPHKVEPPTLQERLARFDIGLSAVGIEHRPGEAWAASIHPLALESVRRREVLLAEAARELEIRAGDARAHATVRRGAGVHDPGGRPFRRDRRRG